MPKNEQDEESKIKRRRKNRIFNTVLYAVSGCLILLGIYIILADQTDLFLKSTAPVPQVTFPPEYVDTRTPAPSNSSDTDPSKPPPTTEPPSGTGTPGTTPKPYDPGPTAAPQPASDPFSIYFMDHDISVAIVPVGVNEKGEMETVPKHDVAGWYKYGPAPNEDGNCIIAGHNRYHGHKGLFSILHKGLKVGDRICVTLENGESVFYRVESINKYKYNAFPSDVMELGGERRLTLITCLGDYDYDLGMSRTRVVAVCKPVG